MPESKNQPSIINAENLVKQSSSNSIIVELLARAKALPKTPGCYFMKDSQEQIIYVGKAKNLKSRVTSYFNGSAKSPKTQILVSHIRSLDFILTESEAQSLVLENNLIKEHRPKYNIRLKDDKSYPYLMVNTSHDFSRLEYIRRPKKKKNTELFGPYPVGFNLSNTMKAATKAFGLRDCKDTEFKSRKEPCILYQMKHCSGSCVGKISQIQYQEDLENALQLFKGPRLALKSVNLIENRMLEYASKENFEMAAMLRDQLEVLRISNDISKTQDVELLDGKNVDVISFFQGEEEVDISFYLVRDGLLLAHRNFHFLLSDFIEDVEDEILNCIVQYYSQSEFNIPETLIVDLPDEKSRILKEALHSIGLRQTKVIGRSKKYKSLVKASKNHAIESQRVRGETKESVFVGLNRLQSLLNLPTRPQTLECYDVAVWQGKSPTASQIVFYEGQPEKALYRYFHLTELDEGNNDFEMMREVFRRRLKYENLPDVFVVDGGVAQVNTVRAVLKDFNVEVPVVGIAKSKNLKQSIISSQIQKSEERLVIPNRSNPYILKKCPSLFRIIVQMRDEAHRFSRKLHHKAEKKRIIKSWVDDVKGIGPEVRSTILKNLTASKDELKKMNITTIKDYLGVGMAHARAIYNHLHESN